MKGQTEGRGVQLSARLRALADMVTPGFKVADVGCDHGLLSIYLVQNGISPGVIAMDVRTGPLSGAEEHIRENGLEAYIKPRLSDGLARLHAGEVQAMVCAGMGGRLMQRILTEGAAVAGELDELILQPQSELFEFRVFLRERGYGVLQEKIVLDEGKYYFMMKVAPGKTMSGTALSGMSMNENAKLGKATAGDAVTEECFDIPQRLADRYGGLLLQKRDPVLLDYLLRERGKYHTIAERIGSSTDAGERAAERREEILRKMADLEEAIKLYGERGERYDYSEN